MEYLASIYFVILSGLKNEIKNNFLINEKNFEIELPDNSKIILSLKMNKKYISFKDIF